MVSHSFKDGGEFLSPHHVGAGDTQSKTADKSENWAIEAMVRYKETGCSKTMEALLIHYMDGYVQNLAKRLAANLPGCIESDDLAQSAYFGLTDCIKKFDPDRKIKFESYSRQRVEGAMKDYLRREDPASRLARTRSKIIDRGVAQFRVEHGRSPTHKELRELLKLSKHDFDAVMKDVHVPNTISFHPTDSEGNESPSGSLQVERHSKELGQIDRIDLRQWLYQQLGHYDRLIVTLHYTENLTMLEVGRFMGYSESRVSQRLKHIHELLKIRMGDHPEIKMLMAS